MANKQKKSVTQRIKDALNNGKGVTENYVVNTLNGSPGFLAKRVSEFRANGMKVNRVEKNGVSTYKLAATA